MPITFAATPDDVIAAAATAPCTAAVADHSSQLVEQLASNGIAAEREAGDADSHHQQRGQREERVECERRGEPERVVVPPLGDGIPQ